MKIHQVLARKWRPKTFKEVIGQEQIISAISNSISLGRIHHAYLFSGTRGIGKTTLTRILAKTLNCNLGVSVAPCCNCNNCKGIESGNCVDVIEIDAASKTRVEDTREIIESVPYKTAIGRFRIYIIDEVHMLSRHSFNALLKTLEEPPSHVKFFLSTTEPQKLPTTILSRCLQFHLNKIQKEKIFNHLIKILKKEKVLFEEQAVKILARSSNGSLRDALSLTDRAIIGSKGKITLSNISGMTGFIDDEQILSVIESIVLSNIDRIIDILNKAEKNNASWDSFLQKTQKFLHNIAIFKVSSLKYVNQNSFKKRIDCISRKLSEIDIQRYYQIILAGRRDLPYSPSYRMGVEMTLLKALSVQLEGNRKYSGTEDESKHLSVSQKILLDKAHLKKKLPDINVQDLLPKDKEKINWASDISHMHLPKLVKELVMNTWIEKKGGIIFLHLRSSKSHLNTIKRQDLLTEALSKFYKMPIKLFIKSDDNLTNQTPLEQEKERLKEEIKILSENHYIKILLKLFNAKLVKSATRFI